MEVEENGLNNFIVIRMFRHLLRRFLLWPLINSNFTASSFRAYFKQDTMQMQHELSAKLQIKPS